MVSVWKLSGRVGMKVVWRTREIVRRAEIALRRVDHRRRIVGWVDLGRQRGGFRRPRVMEARGARQLAVGRRFDLETPIARHTTGARIVVGDLGTGIDGAAA